MGRGARNAQGSKASVSNLQGKQHPRYTHPKMKPGPDAFPKWRCRPVRSRKAFFTSTRPWPLESESISDRSPHRHGRPWRHCDFQSIVMPINPPASAGQHFKR